MLARPQLCLPLTLATGSITVDLASSSDETFSITGATRYASRTGDVADDLWAYFEAAMNAGSALTWSTGDQDQAGKLRLTAQGSEAVTDLTLPAAWATALGYAAAVITPTSTVQAGPIWTTTFDAPYRSQGLYVPEPPDECYYDDADWEDVQTLMTAQSPQGGYTSYEYGSLRRRRLDLSVIRSYSARASYLAASWGVSAGFAAADPHVAWDQFVEAWRASAGAALLFLDAEVPANPKTVYPDVQARWWAQPSAALERVSDAPLRFALRVELLEAV